MKHFRAVIIALLSIAVVVAGLATWWIYSSGHKVQQSPRQTEQSAPKAKAKTKSKVAVVALGDSLTEGVGDQKKQGGYVGQIKQQLTTKQELNVKTFNYGKAGDRSDQIQKRLDNSTKMQGQVKKADAIVMTVGGNDLMQGLQNATATGTTSIKSMDKAVAATQQVYAGRLTSLLTQVRQLNPNAPIFLFSIYNPVYVYFANVLQLNAYVTAFNQTTQETVSSVNKLYFMDINDKMSFGQFDTKTKRAALAAKDAKANKAGDLSGEDVEKTLVSGSTDELNDYLSPADHFHPNHLGYKQMTDKLYKTMIKHDGWLKQK